MKILVADDDAVFLQSISELLRKAGYEVAQATNGKEAQEKALAQPPDLIVLDIILPKLLGTEVCENLRKSSRTSSVPILLITSGVAEIGEHGFQEQFLADDFMRKPLNADEFMDKVKRLAGSKSKFSNANGSIQP
jgi:DNA-binding response OmpR family regulator